MRPASATCSGTKAGRAQFEQLRARAMDFVESPKVQETVSNLSETVKQNAHKLPDPVADVVTAVADSVKGSTTPTDVSTPARPATEPKSPQGQ